jgi:metallo-beta-lactamase family protein
MKLTFWGASRQVTGSMYLLELEDDYKILIDCGSDMERHKQTDIGLPSTVNPNGLFPFEPSQVNLVILTHAHIDHTGMLPNLFREGYEGQVLCTSPTLQLTNLLLHDTAMLNARKLKKIQGESKKKRKFRDFAQSEISALYFEKNVREAIEQFVTIPFNQRFKINKQVGLTFIPTGHLLGAANIILDITENGVQKKICFSGDIGRKNYPLLPDPQRVPQVDYLLCETTYGNRKHLTTGTTTSALAEIIKKTCIDMPGRLIIPAFSVGRTQALLYTVNKIYTEIGMPPVRVFADSPLAYSSTKVYQHFSKMLNKEAQEFYEENETLFDFDNLVYVEDLKQSKLIKNYNEPCIIISSSGMIQGGRVEQHIFDNISNPYCTILMVGYAAEGTIGHDLANGAKSLKLKNGKEIAILANIESIDIFSGHGDVDDLTEFVSWQDKNLLKQLFLIHGEEQSMIDFKNHIETQGYKNVEIPKKGQSYFL